MKPVIEPEPTSAQEAYDVARTKAGKKHGYSAAEDQVSAIRSGSSVFWRCLQGDFAGTMDECGEHALQVMEQDGLIARTQWLEQHQATP